MAVSFMSESYWYLVRGLVLARTGGEGAITLLSRALELIEKVSWPIGRVVALRSLIEAHWLIGDLTAARRYAGLALELIKHCQVPWTLGQIGFWAWRVGLTDLPLDPSVPLEYRHMVSGDWRDAAETWLARGLPYETALACASGDSSGRREAVTILKRLGANATLTRLREEWLDSVVKSLPRGINHDTQKNPVGLTNRQWQLLAMVAQGMDNRTIALQLSRSTRTIEHHVSAILAKLGVSSRQQATLWFEQHRDEE